MMSCSMIRHWLLSVQDTRRFLHAVYRVGDLDGTLEYYKKNFGMKQIRYRDIPEVLLSLTAASLSTYTLPILAPCVGQCCKRITSSQIHLCCLWIWVRSPFGVSYHYFFKVIFGREVFSLVHRACCKSSRSSRAILAVLTPYSTFSGCMAQP